MANVLVWIVLATFFPAMVTDLFEVAQQGGIASQPMCRKARHKLLEGEVSVEKVVCMVTEL